MYFSCAVMWKCCSDKFLVDILFLPHVTDTLASPSLLRSSSCPVDSLQRKNKTTTGGKWWTLNVFFLSSPIHPVLHHHPLCALALDRVAHIHTYTCLTGVTDEAGRLSRQLWAGCHSVRCHLDLVHPRSHQSWDLSGPSSEYYKKQNI